ncbi:MAG: EAL domain-containing protein [Burkholderiales bacterium]|nr:EAL domain-containing protein [Burkholderiales bacterium]
MPLSIWRFFRNRTLTFQALCLATICASSVVMLSIWLAGYVGLADPDSAGIQLAAGCTALLVVVLACVVPVVLRPLSRLTAVVTKVTLLRDYSLRANESQASEVRDLSSAFNQLLAQIQERDRALAHELSEKTAVQKQLAQMAHHDPVTGLHNRHFFQQAVEHALAGTSTSLQLAVMFIDLDDFKQVNDTLGHEAGDAMLREVARRLTGALRKTDIVCRLGGDEFALILPVAGGSAEASQIAAKLLASLATPMRTGEQELFASASIGVAMATAGEIDPVELLRRADVAMYQAKTESKGAFRVFEPHMAVRASRRAVMTQRLRMAVDNGSLSLVYQPQVELKTLHPRKAEALLRWHDEQLGEVSPIEFIRLAEETGSLQAIGHWVIEQACQDTQTLRERTGQEFTIAVNASLSQLCQSAFADMVEDALARYRLSGGQLEIEIAEGSLLSDWSGAERQIRQLRACGVVITLDDFGNSFTALRALRNLPQRLKIDSRPLAGAPADSTEIAIAKGNLSMAAELGLEVVAKCVETRAQLDLVRGLGCGFAQGYLLHRPMTLDSLVSCLLEEERNRAGCGA